MVLERCIQPGFVTDSTHKGRPTFSQQPMCGILHLWCCLTVSVSRKWLYQGLRSPKIFSVPWDKAPPATPTTPSVNPSCRAYTAQLYLWSDCCRMSRYDSKNVKEQHVDIGTDPPDLLWLLQLTAWPRTTALRWDKSLSTVLWPIRIVWNYSGLYNVWYGDRNACMLGNNNFFSVGEQKLAKNNQNNQFQNITLCNMLRIFSKKGIYVYDGVPRSWGVVENELKT